MAPQSPNEALQPEAAPGPPSVPPSRRRPVLSAISGFLSFLLILAGAALAGLVWSQQRIRAPGPLPADKVVYIAPGTDFPDIIADLDHEGVVDSPFLLYAELVLEGNRSKVRAGEYLFKQNASLRDVMDTLVSGKQVLHAITIPEGLTSEQIVERLRDSDVLIGELIDPPKEGSLLPETYKVTRGSSRTDLIKKMQDEQKRVVNQIWSRRTNGLPLHSPYELVTLASIVEKETGKADERSRVAGVFMNRLVKHMRLQSDPTIVYGLVGGKGTLGRVISRAELEKPTPYNTYLVDGLPPGPIANPGRAALEAVANPSRTQELYFVADGSGGHVFSETLDQHARNVQKWRQIEKDAKDKQDNPVQELDRAAPDAAPVVVPRGDQKGEIEAPATSIYGALPKALDPSATPQLAAPSLSFVKANLPAPSSTDPAALAIAQVAAKAGAKAERGKTAAARAGNGSGKAASPFSAFAMGPGLDELGITVRGAPGLPAAAMLDGPIGASANADGSTAASEPASFSDLQSRQAERKARAAGFGSSPGADVPPTEAAQAAAAASDAPQTSGAGPTHPRIIDVSEGTALDPLRDKTYDLNYPKTVPSFK